MSNNSVFNGQHGYRWFINASITQRVMPLTPNFADWEWCEWICSYHLSDLFTAGGRCTVNPHWLASALRPTWLPVHSHRWQLYDLWTIMSWGALPGSKRFRGSLSCLKDHVSLPKHEKVTLFKCKVDDVYKNATRFYHCFYTPQQVCASGHISVMWYLVWSWHQRCHLPVACL